jgi:hypothetical protein
VVAIFALTATLCISHQAAGQTAVLTHHNDLERTGATTDTVLTQSNVAVATFGKLFTRKVDGKIFAQPLYVPKLRLSNGDVRNVVFVCTLHNRCYAFDADDRALAAPLWQRILGDPVPSIVIADSGFSEDIGVLSTPVIDASSQTMYVVASTLAEGLPTFQLHALDITTGAERAGSPVVIQGSAAGTGVGSVNGQLAFNASMHLQRPALVLLNHVVYIAFGSHNDAEPYHGWVFGYSVPSLERVAIRCLTPTGEGAAVWQGGAGLAADADGYLYLITGDGTNTTASGGHDYGDSFVKLDPVNNLAVVDFFSPSNQASLDSGDVDLGSGCTSGGAGYVVDRRRGEGWAPIRPRPESPRRLHEHRCCGAEVAGEPRAVWGQRVLRFEAISLGTQWRTPGDSVQRSHFRSRQDQ